MIESIVNYIFFKVKSILSFLKYRKKTQIIFCNSNFEIIERVYDLKYLPKQGETISLSDNETYYIVLRLIHKIASNKHIWIVVEPRKI
jgi:hypothetical protein